ncbi:MAG: hypothetical protein M3N43_01165 [Actinomycetota bacterium]|nr:hypothetical protein [Actinomycetota bacterium]
MLILTATFVGRLSRSIAIDFISWWPVWVVLLLFAFLARGRRWGRVRVSAVVAIVTVLTLGLFVTGHVLGWAAMPSASTRLIGPGPGSATTVALSAQVDGVLEVGSGQSGFLYAVEPVRNGGDVGPPAAVEQIQGANLSVRLEPVGDPGLYTFAGWTIDLEEGPLWNLSLGGEVNANLRRLRLAGLQLNGDGRASLGTVSESVVVNISGTFEIAVPPATPVRVVGDAVVPGSWVDNAEGSASPTAGDGWVFSVGDGSALTVTEG